MMMGYVITVTEDDVVVRIAIAQARCASNVYHWARAQGHDVTINNAKALIPNRTELEVSLAQEILNEWVANGLTLG